MREIKFRGWHKEDRHMSYGMPRTGVTLPLLHGEGEYKLDCSVNEFEWMQFTGLKDKNGREIFEGDITLLDYGRGKRIAVVEWQADSASFVLRTQPDGFLHMLQGVTARADEIIGNRCENPELVPGTP